MDNIEEMSDKEKKISKAKVGDKLKWVNPPYSYEKKDGTHDFINTIDCI